MRGGSSDEGAHTLDPKHLAARGGRIVLELSVEDGLGDARRPARRDEGLELGVLGLKGVVLERRRAHGVEGERRSALAP